MNKQEYLERLQACLKHHLSREEIEDIMRDYAEYFEEGRRQSKQDSEIAAKLGDPELVAEQLIEESQEQQAEYKVTGKIKEKTLGKYVEEYWEKAKKKFHDWDHSEGREEKAEPSEQSDAEPEHEQPLGQQESVKKPKAKREQTGDGVLVRSLKVLARACRWCAILFVCFWVVLLALCLGGMVLCAAVFVLGAILFGIVLCGCGFIMGLLGIVGSGFVVMAVGTWSGAAVLFGSVACIALTALLEMLLIRCLRFCWDVCKKVCSYATDSGEQMLTALGRWLGVPQTEKEAAKEQPEKVEVEVLPPTTPVPVQEQPQQNQEEGC